MADTFTAYFSGVGFTQNKNMGALLNQHATDKIKLTRVGLINAQTGAVTGVTTELNLRAYQTGSPNLTTPTAVTPISHDSANAALSSLVCGHAGTIAGTALVLRRTIWSNDEPATGTLTNDELECFIPWNIIWDSGYGDSNLQYLTLNQNQMVLMFNVTNTAVGTLDTWMEFIRTT